MIHFVTAVPDAPRGGWGFGKRMARKCHAAFGSYVRREQTRGVSTDEEKENSIH